jgi:spore maturation protein CgeB
MKKLKILFVGDLNKYGRSIYRSNALKNLGHFVKSVSHSKIADRNSILKHSLLYRISWKLKFPIDESGVNKKIISELDKKKYDLLWLEKGNDIKPSTLVYVKKKFTKIKIISISEDDMFASHSHSYWYRLGLSKYDKVFTTKLYNLTELLSFGAISTELFMDSYIDEIHKPIKLSNNDSQLYSADVSAIGAYEFERAETLYFLAINGIKVTVWGSNWSLFKKKHKNLVIKNSYLFNESYTKAIIATKINLNFLRKVNRDEITSRSIEIPACGGFMITERTDRQINLFREGIEAEYFSSNEELLKKINYYLKNPTKRKKISTQGRLCCITKKLSNKEQMKLVLSKI